MQNEKGLPSKDSYVDLTQIFKISKDDFEKVFNKNDVIYLDSNDLNHEDITKIYNGLYENLSQEPLVFLLV
ncbi:Mbov_0400 family ICE element protein [Mycoplasmopsis cynos]|uniref:Mbov_0400 family ICE element protein n=1 Tax=Mycoplasmopsis cynos TaxID=171284 RepID=UPI003A5C7F70